MAKSWAAARQSVTKYAEMPAGSAAVERLEPRQLLTARLSADLAYLASDFASRAPVAAAARAASPVFHLSAGQPNAPLIRNTSTNRVYIKAVSVAKTSTALANQLKAIGATISARYGRVVSASVPIALLARLDSLADLRFATPAYRPVYYAGSVDGLGATAIGSETASKQFSVDGTGVTVGILSDSFNKLGGASAGVASGDLPAVNIVKEDPFSATDEGRAVAEIVHDVAPGAGIAFYTGDVSQADMAVGVTQLAKPVSAGGAGAKVLVDNVGFFDEPIYQDGIVAQAINNAAATYGTAHFSAAGNAGRNAYESAFTGTSQTVPGVGSGTFHDFDSSAGTDIYQPITLPAGQTFAITYQWDQPYASAGGAGSASTMGAYLLNPTKTAVIASADSSRIGLDPIQVLAYTNNTGSTQTFYLALRQITGAAPGAMKYINLGQGTIANYATNTGAAFGHSLAAGGMSVGAASYASTPAYQQTASTESYSSAGGTAIRFDSAGNRLATPQVRQQPAIAAVDGVATTFFGDLGANGVRSFYGTSAAAPHAAAVAALMLQAKPSLTNAQVYSTLTSTALDIGAAGYDFDSGYGLIQADAALRAVAGSSISGAVFQDANNDGIFNGAETAIAGQTVFIDDNNDGTRQIDIASTISSADTPKAIADAVASGNASRTTSAVTVSGVAGRVKSVAVNLNVSHPDAKTLGLTLITPAGIRIPLLTNVASGTGFNLTLSDIVSAYIQSASAAGVLTGQFKPQSKLAAAAGEAANGTWLLETRDYVTGNTGTINGWSLSLTTTEQGVTADANGVYAFTGLSPSSFYGSYNVRSGAISGLSLTTPATPYAVSLVRSQNAGGINFVYASAAAVSLTSIVLNGGRPDRSNVSELVLQFDGVIPAGNFQAGAFTLTQNSGPVVQSYSVNLADVSSSGGGTSVRLSFAGAGVVNGSVGDGRYTLSVDGSKITSSTGGAIDAAGTGTPGSARAFNFFRLQGDADGNAVVNFNDFLLMQNAFNTTSGQANFNAGADCDGNGAVNFNDFLLLQNQFERSV